MKYNGCILSYCLLLVIMVTGASSIDNTWAVKLTHTHSHWHETNPNTLADKVAMEMGLTNQGRIEPFLDLYKFTETKSRHARRSDNDILENHANILWSSKQVVLKRTKRAGAPLINRGFPTVVFNDPKYSNQWHLHNTMETGHDVNTTGVWRHNVTGRGVVVAVVDDGLEYTNTDLLSNYEPLGSYDFNGDDADPSPDLTTKLDNSHGTRCAGLIAAVANNSVCGVGVAFGSRVSGIRMLDGSVTDILEAQSFVYKAHVNDIYSCSWGPEDNGRSIEGPGKLAKEALNLGTLHGRYGYGNVYVFASGNGGNMMDNCNFDGYANSVHTLTIGAVDELNRMPYYAEPCAAMLAVTYSNGQRRSIVTTDCSNHGGCTDGFSGTSAAAPIAAGMIALMLEVRPCLTWRDVQAIVIYSALKVDVGGAHWVGNGARFHHSDQHGFGLMDTYRLTVTAAVWPLLPAMVMASVEGGREVAMPTGGQPLIQTVKVTHADIPDGLTTLEYVAVTIGVAHVCRGSLEVTLTSPAATPSTLITPRRYDNSQDGFYWTFTSARFWGEGPVGQWTLNMTDHVTLCPGRVREGGMVYNWTLTFWGSSVTPEDVMTRQELVEEAVSNGSVESPFPCPPTNNTHHDIVISDTPQTSFNIFEKVGLTIVAVFIAVTCLHFTLDFVYRRVKGRCRPRSTPTSVLYVNRGNKESEETCALLLPDTEHESVIFIDDDSVRCNENSNNSTSSVQAIIPLDDVTDQSDAAIPNENLHNDNCGGTDSDHGNVDPVDETSLLLQTEQQ